MESIPCVEGTVHPPAYSLPVIETFRSSSRTEVFQSLAGTPKAALARFTRTDSCEKQLSLSRNLRYVESFVAAESDGRAGRVSKRKYVSLRTRSAVVSVEQYFSIHCWVTPWLFDSAQRFKSFRISVSHLPSCDRKDPS